MGRGGAARGASAAWRVVRLGAGCEVHRWSVIPLSAHQLSDSLSLTLPLPRALSSRMAKPPWTTQKGSTPTIRTIRRRKSRARPTARPSSRRRCKRGHAAAMPAHSAASVAQDVPAFAARELPPGVGGVELGGVASMWGTLAVCTTGGSPASHRPSHPIFTVPPPLAPHVYSAAQERRRPGDAQSGKADAGRVETH